MWSPRGRRGAQLARCVWGGRGEGGGGVRGGKGEEGGFLNQGSQYHTDSIVLQDSLKMKKAYVIF